MDMQRQWPLDRFVALVAALRGAGVSTVEIGGHAPKLGTDRALCQGVHYRQTAAILAACDIFVGNDSGSFHLAAAVGTPQIVMFGPIKAAARAYSSTTGYDDMDKITHEEIAAKCGDLLEQKGYSKCPR
jgi:ADP-heptose:LPS heptosyltransferase